MCIEDQHDFMFFYVYLPVITGSCCPCTPRESGFQLRVKSQVIMRMSFDWIEGSDSCISRQTASFFSSKTTDLFDDQWTCHSSCFVCLVHRVLLPWWVQDANKVEKAAEKKSEWNSGLSRRSLEMDACPVSLQKMKPAKSILWMVRSMSRSRVDKATLDLGVPDSKHLHLLVWKTHQKGEHPMKGRGSMQQVLTAGMKILMQRIPVTKNSFKLGRRY